MRKLFLLAIVVCMLSIAGACWSYPSLLGPTGGANLPLASVIDQGKAAVAVDFVNDGVTIQETDGAFIHTNKLSNTVSFRGIYGIAPNTEIGLVYNSQKDTITDTDPTYNSEEGEGNWGVNAKYAWSNVYPNTTFAAGTVYQSFTDDVNVVQVYGVATHRFSAGSAKSPAVRGSLGANWTRVKDASDSINAVRPFVDVDLAFANGLNVTAEYQFKSSKFNEKALSSIVARYPLNKEKTVIGEIGFTNAYRGVIGTDDHSLVLGASYIFGK